MLNTNIYSVNIFEPKGIVLKYLSEGQHF